MSKAPQLPSRGAPRRRFLGRYELIGELARGGMGTVYLARHAGEAGFQRMFAIKVLHEHLEADSSFVDMLRDEARLAARIHHPNVVAIVDLGSHGRQHYVVMDYVEGPTLATLWKRGRTSRPVDLMVSILIDALDGLHAAHTLKGDEGEELRLVHRDVSPQNILVGVDGVARITDFGIAKAESRIGSTQPGMRKGKLQFMSPEQVKDEGELDQRTDVWAMGVILWSLLCSEHLFRGDNDAATVHNILMKPVVPPSTMPSKPPPFFDDIVRRALARSPEARFSSALEMAEALRKVATDNGVLGSRQQIATFVEETFADELERRRQAIRDVVRKRTGEDLTDHSQVTVLPSLPSQVLSGPPGAEIATETDVAVDPLPGGTRSSLPLETLETLGAHEVGTLAGGLSRRTWVIAGAAVAVVAALGVSFCTRDTSKPQAAGLPAETPSARPAQGVAASAMQAPSSLDPVALVGAPGGGAELQKPARPAAGSARPPRIKAPAAVPNGTPAPAAPSRPPAPAQPHAGDEFEGNPYIRR